MQRGLYRLCNISPLDFWKYTPAETELMIEAAKEEFEVKMNLRAQFLSCLMNAPHVTRSDKKCWEPKHFLPEKEQELTADQIEAVWAQYCQ
jgi:hypothetical protein